MKRGKFPPQNIFRRKLFWGILLSCIIFGGSVLVIRSSSVLFSPAHNSSRPINTPNAPVVITDSARSSALHATEQALLDNIEEDGFDSNPAINGGLGGLWINWEYGTWPLKTDFNGTGKTDQQADAPLRHDPLTDIRYLHALWLYKSQNPKDTHYDSEIAKFTAIIKMEWANAHDAQRGWLYDEEFADLFTLTHDPFYQQQMLNLASAYEKSIDARVGIYFKTSSTHPEGYYRPEDALETGLALVQAGTQFNNLSWVRLGQNEVNFVYAHAYIPQYHTFPGQMDQVLTSSGAINPMETFYIDKYRNYIVYGDEIQVADIGQIIISLLDTYKVTLDRSYLEKAVDLLNPLSARGNLLQLWDSTRLGYYENVTFSGKTPQQPGIITVARGKKNPGRQMIMLWAFHLADQCGQKYQEMENLMLNVGLARAYYAPGHGVLYEMRSDWSPVKIKSIAEDWVTAEAMCIELEALLKANPA